MWRYNWQRQERTTQGFVGSMRMHRKRYRSVMSRSIDRLILIMHRHSKLRKWARKWMSLSVHRRKCMKRASSKLVHIRMRLILGKKRLIGLRGN